MMEYSENNLMKEIRSESNLKKYIGEYEKLLNKYSKELDVIKGNINEALFSEYLITIKSRINRNEEIVRIIESIEDSSYFIPIFTDEYEYVKGIEDFEFEGEMGEEPYVTKIDEIVEIGKADSSLKGIIINPHDQNFRVDMKSIIEYSPE